MVCINSSCVYVQPSLGKYVWVSGQRKCLGVAFVRSIVKMNHLLDAIKLVAALVSSVLMLPDRVKQSDKD